MQSNASENDPQAEAKRHATREQPAETGWFDSRLRVGASRIQGMGILATGHIEEGEVVMVWGGRLFTVDDVTAGRAKPHSLSGYGEGVYLGQAWDDPDTLDQFLNHSCNPNLWMLDEVTIEARRAINVGEELTADYALWEFNPAWHLSNCRCGARECRGKITGDDWRLTHLQVRYAGHFLPYLQERITADIFRGSAL